ncbi:hypothetical protein [Haloferula sp. BvORR071]|uniref:hypothetical protein n=1 Tax=Haloferula sp. BvORR071 TaxID=1396141 RepID=UPI00055744F7|nr:hypothetical protein [Haloferula sp. BvORR071]
MNRLLFIFLLFISSARACYWDRDTLAEEAKGQLDVVKASIGWFDRYPPHYYEMRLERVTKEITADPKQLDLYDDAGVACSRLGQHTKAIAWMTLKKAILDTLPQDASTAEARYRYLSNTGTFHLVRWMTAPEAERNADLTDLRESEKLIAAALELNPDAHFGREKFQHMLITWLLDPALDHKRYQNSNFLRQNTAGNHGGEGQEKPQGGADYTYAESTRGITGLIQLGAAWESVDTFRALQTSLGGEHRNYLAKLAELRLEQLRKAGNTSLHPSAAIRELAAEGSESGMIYGESTIAGYFQGARAAATERETAWLAYQEECFAKGEHPDTHPQFWSAWKEPVFPEIPERGFSDEIERNPIGFFILVLGTIGLLVLAAIVSLIVRAKRKPRPIPTAQEAD